jgi:hypothetical protein
MEPRFGGLVFAMRFTMTSWLTSGRPRQFFGDMTKQAMLNLVP